MKKILGLLAAILIISLSVASVGRAVAWEKDAGADCTKVFANIQNSDETLPWDGYIEANGTQVFANSGNAAPGETVEVSWVPPAGFSGEVKAFIAIRDGENGDSNEITEKLDCPAASPTPGNPGVGGPAPETKPYVCPVDPKPGDTTLLSVVKVGSDSVKLTWTPASDATDYTISYGLGDGNNIYGVPSTGNVTTYTIGSLDLSKKYCFNVIALNDCRQGKPSNPVCTALGGPITTSVLGLSNTSSGSDNSILLVIAAALFISSGSFLLLKTSGQK